MKGKQRSRTAETVAACRAWHLVHEDPIVFRDPFAIQLMPRTMRMIIKSRFLKRLIAGRKKYAYMCPLRAEILGRACFAEEQLEKAIKVGINQYVVLGAGLDSFALRRGDLTSSLKVYELDHPVSQSAKRSRLANLNIDLPKNLEFVPIDFERESVADALTRSSCSNEQPAFFSWLGVIPYLTHEAIFDTLRLIAAYAKSGSEIVFDYHISKELIDPVDVPIRDWVERSVARRGEPQITTLDPNTLEHAVHDLGFELIEHLSPAEQKKRYFAGRKDGLRPISYAYFAHFRLRM